MRFHWLFLSALTWLLVAAPAWAGKLVFWRFDTNENRLVFTTDNRVQPRAQMITNPTRIVIDLPGIKLGQPNINRPIGNIVRSVRIGQFDAETTRLVIELAPGYTFDPQQVKIRGISPTQWTVELPEPQPIREETQPPVTPDPTPPPDRGSTRPTPPPPVSQTDNNDDFQVTRNGLFVRLEQNGDERSIRSQRSRDGKKIEFELPGATLPSSLTGQTIPVNRYGVGDIQFSQTANQRAKISLSVNKDSPDWQALYSRFGGLVLLPRGGLGSVDNISSPPPTSATNPNPRPNNPPPKTANNPPSSNRLATISSIDLAGNNDRLLIRADLPLKANGSVNRDGVYELSIENAKLAESFRGPRFGRSSPIYQLRVRQESSNRVLILVQTAAGFQLGQLTQTGNQTLALELLSSRNSSPVSQVPDSTTIPVPLPPNTGQFNPPPRPSNPTPNPPQQRNSRFLVVIDPGHGGKDPGAIGIGGLQEKNVILPISLEVTRILQQQGIDVRLTRDSDFFVTLQGRTDLANRIDADLFVSIHANSMGKGRPDVNGLEVYYFGDRRLSDTIHRNIVRSVDMRDRGVRRARFYVLRTSRMPSTLVEVGFVTGAEDAAKLANVNFQRQMAAAIARGIMEYIQRNLR
ncbi:N-acetylmuramoyl-L-alanine amidase [Microcystis aeruginosa PCC 9809]|uniref:N-acetylmuramoyl-L-alanine amidase n=1 Tax=Microcystis aeruginosa PCC 9809 TaxID=1160285 RepID=I4HLW7_MICAE|nr:N-acetylmuramoyl-L-alanine amidase [Microcystis aeruginosa]CCI23041.1 N-acetylmuramoyl-L-alanine amidase [Microcystis aeruginosa PCC 9809]